jgi:hypothetical protein
MKESEMSNSGSWRWGLASRGLMGLLGVIGLSWSVQAQTLGPLVRVTGGDPFDTCTSDNLRTQQTAYGSTLYPNTVIEPWIAVDPTDPSRLLVGTQQDRWDDGGARGLVGVVSNDGGASWTNSIPLHVTRCTRGNYVRASDPSTAFANDGTAFFFSLVFDPATSATPFNGRHSGALMSRSTDHGASWSRPLAVVNIAGPDVLNDKNSVTTDPTKNGNVYAVWDQLRVFSAAGESLIAGGEGVPIARKLFNSRAGASLVCAPFNRPPCKAGAALQQIFYTGPSFLALSTDNGLSWGKATAIYSPGTNQQTINNIVQVLPAGDVLDFFTAIGVTGPFGLDIGFVRSTNKAVSWSGPAFATDIQVAGVVTPDKGEPVRDASTLFGVSVNQKTGAIYLTWQDDRFSAATCTTPTGTIPVDAIAFSQSLDGGRHWSTPIKINRTPMNANPCRQQAFIPAVVASGDGNFIVVTYYDFRNDTNATAAAGFEATDYFTVFCDTTTDCTRSGNWGNEQRLTTASFNILDAPSAGGHFLGDYMGLAASGPTTAYPLFGVATGKNLTVQFTRAISTSRVRILN